MAFDDEELGSIIQLETIKKEVKKHIEHINKLEKRNPKRKYLMTPLIKWIKYFFELDEGEKPLLINGGRNEFN